MTIEKIGLVFIFSFPPAIIRSSMAVTVKEAWVKKAG